MGPESGSSKALLVTIKEVRLCGFFSEMHLSLPALRCKGEPHSWLTAYFFLKFRLQSVRWFHAGTIPVGLGNDVKFRYFLSTKLRVFSVEWIPLWLLPLWLWAQKVSSSVRGKAALKSGLSSSISQHSDEFPWLWQNDVFSIICLKALG